MPSVEVVQVLEPEDPDIVEVLGTEGLDVVQVLIEGPQGSSDAYTSTYSGIGDAVQAGDGSWTGTDHTVPLRSWIASLDARGRADDLVIKGRIPRGKYLFTGALIQLANRYRDLDIGGDGDETVLVNNTSNGTCFTVSGDSTGQETSADMFLTAPAALRAQTVTVNTTAGLVIGQWIILRDTSQPFHFDEAINLIGYAGQAVQIEGIAGNVIDLRGDCEFSYNANTTVVVRYTTANNLYFHDFAFDYGPTPTPTNFAMDLIRCSNVRVKNILFQNRKALAIRMNETFVFEVDGIRDIGASNVEAYTVEVQNGSAFGLVRGVYLEGGRHVFDSGGDKDWIPASHTTVSDCIAISTESNGFDTHENCRAITFDGVRSVCQANAGGDDGAGILIRGRQCRVINSEFYGYGIGVYFAFGGDGLAENNLIRRCNQGISLNAVDHTVVRGNTIVDCVKDGVELQAIGDGCVIENNTITGALTGFGIYSSNPVWNPTWIIRGNRIPDAAAPYNGQVPAQIYSSFRSTAANYTLKAEDGSGVPGIAPVDAVRRVLERASTGANTVTIPANAALALAVGSRIEVLQHSTGLTSIVPDVGVTLNGLTTPMQLPGQYGLALLRQRAVNDWVVAMLPTMLKAQATYDPISLIDGASDTTTVALPGVILGDFAAGCFNKDLAGVALAVWVSAADTVSVRFTNRTGVTVNLAPGQIRVWVIKA